MSNAYEAVNDTPRQICAFGDTFVQALDEIVRYLKDNDLTDPVVSAINHNEDHGEHYVVVVITE